MSKDMKLIMERFRKNLNEMPAGLGMPLTVGAATAGGKAEKAANEKAKEKEKIKAANNKLLKQLVMMGSEPQFIELDPGDIKGAKIDANLAELMNGHLRDYLNDPKLGDASVQAGLEFMFQNGKITYGDYRTGKAAKINPGLFAGFLSKVLVTDDLSSPARDTIGFRDILGI